MANPDQESMTLRLPPHIRAGLATLAARYGVTATSIARMAIAEYLESRGALDQTEAAPDVTRRGGGRGDLARGDSSTREIGE